MLLLYAAHGKTNAQDLTDIGKQKPISFSGSVQAQGIYYNASGIGNRQQPWTYFFNGSPTISLYGISIPLSFSLSAADRSFRQPFNQYGMSPTYKWVTLHVGYRDLSFSPYTLGGHTMFGAGFELTPGKLRVGFMYGRLNAATTIDTTTRALVPFSFSRKGYALKLGYGSEQNFFEFSYLTARDDSTTKPAGLQPDQNYISPAKNNVLGYTARFSLFKNFIFNTDGAASVYTNDINSPIQLENGDNQLLNKLRGTLGLNGTSEFYTAFSAGMGYQSKKYGVKLQYKRIDPDFKTMGAYYFSSDFENWTIDPNATLINGKVRINGSLGFQHDNVKNQKRATNHRVIGSANAGIDFSKNFAMDVVYTNFSDNQQAKTVLFADSLKIVQTTQTMTFMPRYTIIKPDVVHIISATFSLNSLKDYNTFYSADAVSHNVNTTQVFAAYNVSFPKRMLTAYINIGNTLLKGQGMRNSYASATVGANKTMYKQKLLTGLSGTFTSTKDATGNNALIINANGMVGYRVDEKQSLNLNFFLTNNKAKSTGINALPSFTETRGELSYLLNF